MSIEFWFIDSLSRRPIIFRTYRFASQLWTHPLGLTRTFDWAIFVRCSITSIRSRVKGILVSRLWDQVDSCSEDNDGCEETNPWVVI